MKTTPCSVQYTKSTVFFSLDLTPKAKPSLTNELQGPKFFFFYSGTNIGD